MSRASPVGMRIVQFEGDLISRKKLTEEARNSVHIGVLETLPLWQLDVAEVKGHNLEARGREEVNRLLNEGWRLLHIYTLKYEEDGVWRERPMAILGRLTASQGGEAFEKK